MGNKILYGIDLGTTNSAISRFNYEEASVIKNALNSDTTSSCVSVNPKGRLSIGQRAYSQLGRDLQNAFIKENYEINSFVEFKRVMGTDALIHCSNLQKDFKPEELSAEVLKELRKYVLNEEVKSAVITVPAMFDNNQKDATKRAAKLAGFEYYELIQEPVAASIAYGLSAKIKNAYWLVFDFGGGTFDAALMKIEDGIMKPVDTAGNNHLGGKDIDSAIVEQLFMPYFKDNYSLDGILSKKGDAFKAMWKPKAEEAKINLSFNPSYFVETDFYDYGTDDDGTPFELSINITQDMLETVSRPIFQKAVDIVKALLARHNMTGDDLGSIILVGGPTHSPIIRRMLSEQIADKVDTSIDPMTCVANGAAMYASTLSLPDSIADISRDRTKIQLSVDVKSTTVEDIEFASVKFLADKCENNTLDCVFVEFVRGDGAFSSGKIKIDTIGDVIDLPLLNDRTNIFKIHCYNSGGDKLDCEPSEISIIQGIDGIGDAVMPMALGIGVSNEEGDEIFVPVEGCMKNQLLPANGQVQGLLTPKDLRVGIKSDYIRISLYQQDECGEDTKAMYCNHLYDVEFTGDDIPAVLPMGSEVNIRLHADKSGTVDKFIVNVPYLDLDLDITDRITVCTKGVMSESFFNNELKSLRKKATLAKDEDMISKLDEIEHSFNASGNDRDAKEKAAAMLKEVGRNIDTKHSAGEWSRTETELRRMYKELLEDNGKYGNAETTKLVDELKKEADKAINAKNIKYAKEVRERMWSLDYKIAEVDYYIVWIYRWDKNFENHSWSNRDRARQLINVGLKIISEKPTADRLRPIAMELHNMLPNDQRPADILRR